MLVPIVVAVLVAAWLTVGFVSWDWLERHVPDRTPTTKLGLLVAPGVVLHEVRRRTRAEERAVARRHDRRSGDPRRRARRMR